MQSAASPVYGESHVTIPFRVCDLRWRPCGRLVRFVAVTHPSRGSCVLMCTDTSLDAVEIIRLYGLRFKIEHRFKQAAHLIGSFSYHFWMQDMKPLARNSGDQFLHRESQRYRHAVTAKLHAYHVFSQADVPPSELVVAPALRQTLPDFLVNTREPHSLAKCIVERQDLDTLAMFRLAS